jgi:DNA-directed RNA polymerase subunit H (RpoH/RPB5)
MDYEILDLIVRSRSTILEILENRGYDVDSYKGVSPETLFEMSVGGQHLLRIIARKRPDGPAPMERAVVLYWVDAPVRLKIEAEVNKLWDDKNPEYYDKTRDEIVVILAEPPHDVFHLQSAKQWTTHKVRVSFFQLKNIISNPAKHMFVPPHRKLNAEEVTELMAGLHLKSKSELPHIKYHLDMQARVLGLVPGDIVEIKRPSETCGEYTFYRVCVI